MVDKPGRRKKRRIPWGKIAAVAVLALVVGLVGWVVYWNYIYVPPPVYAVVGTSLGSFDVELFPACAPKTVSNFVNLANSGFYDNLVWHRIIPGFVIQTGDPNSKNAVNSTRSTWGQGGSNNTVPLEICGWLHNYAGFVGMARQGNQTSGLNTGTSQFYILLDNQTLTTYQLLDGYYTIFGKVISGMNVVCSIASPSVKTYGAAASQNGDSITDQPINPVFLKNVTIISAASAPAPQPISACKT
jgi:cyclophilin family peptidyl-prolyl cis-trans isomerase